jgi:hypothetical protein
LLATWCCSAKARARAWSRTSTDSPRRPRRGPRSREQLVEDLVRPRVEEGHRDGLLDVADHLRRHRARLRRPEVAQVSTHRLGVRRVGHRRDEHHPARQGQPALRGGVDAAELHRLGDRHRHVGEGHEHPGHEGEDPEGRPRHLEEPRRRALGLEAEERVAVGGGREVEEAGEEGPEGAGGQAELGAAGRAGGAAPPERGGRRGGQQRAVPDDPGDELGLLAEGLEGEHPLRHQDEEQPEGQGKGEAGGAPEAARDRLGHRHRWLSRVRVAASRPR